LQYGEYGEESMSVRKPTAYICQCSQDSTYIETLLVESGFDVKPSLSLSAIVQLISESPDYHADLVVSCIQDGGLAVPQIFSQFDTELRPMIALIDRSGDIPSAIKALRMKVTDYLLLREGEDKLRQRLSLIAKRIEERGLLSAEIMAELQGATSAMPQGHAVAYAGGGAHATQHNIWWDSNLCAIRSDDMWVPLSPIEWKLFETLVNKRGAVVSTEDLIFSALSRTGTTAADTSLLRLHVSRLRAKLNEHFAQELSIVTMRGRGYMLV
jgi:DNA-binding response OmpR family regulator